MKLAKVVGTVVATIKAPIFEERALLLVDLLEPDGRPSGGYLIAVDTVGAGAGETVLVLDEGTSARQIVGEPSGPLRTVIVGIASAASRAPTMNTSSPGPAVSSASAATTGWPTGSSRRVSGWTISSRRPSMLGAFIVATTVPMTRASCTLRPPRQRPATGRGTAAPPRAPSASRGGAGG